MNWLPSFTEFLSVFYLVPLTEFEPMNNYSVETRWRPKEKRKQKTRRTWLLEEERQRTDRQFFRVALEDAFQVQLLDLALEPRRQARVHRRAARQHDVLVERRPHVDVGRLDRRKHQLGDA